MIIKNIIKWLIKKNLKICQHKPSIIAQKHGRKKPFIKRFCSKCKKDLGEEKLSYAPRSYIVHLAKDDFITIQEAKEALEEKWINSCMKYNIFVDG